MQKNFYQMLDDVQAEYNRLLNEKKKLKEENFYLKSENYKDEELKKLEQINARLSVRCYQYGLDNEDYQALMDWWKKHEVQHNRSDKIMKNNIISYSIVINEFAEVTCYTIKCNKCGAAHSVYI